MTFDAWWETLTDAERRLLGENNAKFVWNVAFKEGYSAAARDIKNITEK